MNQSEVIAAGPLPGMNQSAFRAEVFGALQAVRFGRKHGVRIRLWTDCLGVVKRLRKIQLNAQIKPSVPHSDLWEELVDELQSLGAHNFLVTKVAAHQDISDAEGPLEQWAYLHNSLVDRAARLANMCRDQTFWSLHAEYASEVEHVKRIVSSVQQVILNIGRSAVFRDEYNEAPATSDEAVSGPRSKMHTLDHSSRREFCLSDPLPISACERFGFRLTSLLFEWLRHAVEQSVGEQPAWVSFYQLYIDFQCATGEVGPIYKNGWVDPRYRPNILQVPADFRKRCMWFTKLFKHVVQRCGGVMHQATTRPESVQLQLHTSSVWIQWPSERLSWIEQWLGQHLSKSATREGSSLRALPVAKRDRKWSEIHVCAEPLRF